MATSHERAHHDDANNVTYQRCLYAYEYAKDYVRDKQVLDIGCGLGYGTSVMARYAREITGVDYDEGTVESNIKKYVSQSNMKFVRGSVPPLDFPDGSFDVVTAFQFIEHIHRRPEMIKECLRVLRKGGVLLITTPNIKKSLARNPFHVHEYTFAEMRQEVGSIFSSFELLGLKGNEKVNAYYAANGRWVRAILKLDILGLHKILPSGLLVKPYNLITNIMRKSLMRSNSQTTGISLNDFSLDKAGLDEALDIYVMASKN